MNPSTLYEGGRVGHRLIVIRRVCEAFVDDLRPLAGDERRVRGILLALVAAMHNGTLDTLADTVRPWMRAELARVDAEREAEPEPAGEGPFVVVAEIEVSE